MRQSLPFHVDGTRWNVGPWGVEFRCRIWDSLVVAVQTFTSNRRGGTLESWWDLSEATADGTERSSVEHVALVQAPQCGAARPPLTSPLTPFTLQFERHVTILAARTTSKFKRLQFRVDCSPAQRELTRQHHQMWTISVAAI